MVNKLKNGQLGKFFMGLFMQTLQIMDCLVTTEVIHYSCQAIMQHVYTHTAWSLHCGLKLNLLYLCIMNTIEVHALKELSSPCD